MRDEQEREAIDLLAQIGFEWAGEYGFSDPDGAKEVWAAAKLIRPEMEPNPDPPMSRELAAPRRDLVEQLVHHVLSANPSTMTSWSMWNEERANVTYEEAMATVKAVGKTVVTRPGLPGPLVYRLGQVVMLTHPTGHIPYTPTAEDMAADDWHIHPGKDR